MCARAGRWSGGNGKSCRARWDTHIDRETSRVSQVGHFGEGIGEELDKEVSGGSREGAGDGVRGEEVEVGHSPGLLEGGVQLVPDPAGHAHVDMRNENVGMRNKDCFPARST